MNNLLLHEEIYRGVEAVASLAKSKVVICGAGALGSNLAETLVRQGLRDLRVIDFDRVETHNLNTQCYDMSDIGQLKTLALKNRLFRAMQVEIEAESKRFESKTARKSLKGADLVVDTFDNNESRQLVQDRCRQAELPCLHAGLNGEYGQVVWDAEYMVPTDELEGDACDYPLARNLAVLVASIAAEEVVEFFVQAEPRRQCWSLTLRDLKIGAYR